MCIEATNYRFVKNGKPAVSEIGCRKIKSLKNPAIGTFYSTENILGLSTALTTAVAEKERYRQVKENDYVPDFTIDVNDECYKMPKLASQLAERPNEIETLRHIKCYFPSVKVQNKIIDCKSRQLVHALAYWAGKIQAVWQDVFGHNKPAELFSERLLPYIK